jgi:hypothetical protein
MTWGDRAAEQHEKDQPTSVRYPKGTPEYDAYRAELAEELEKFATRQPPYDRPVTGYRGAARDAGFGL